MRPVAVPLQRERPVWYVEVVLLVGGYLAFGLARAGLDRGGERLATSNAALVHGLERSLGLAVEHPLNQAVLGHPAAMYSTGYFYRCCLVAVPIILVWLYRSGSPRYRQLRTVLVVVTLLDLPLVWLFPESPPRFAGAGIVDYIARYDIAFGAGSGDPRPGLNLLAAMPSMHVAWMTWCAHAVWSVLRASRLRRAWWSWLLPALTAVVVVVTGHHYVLDVVGGVVVLAAAVWLVRGSRAFVASRLRQG